MAIDGPAPFLLFAAGAPDAGDDGRDIASQLSFFRRFAQLPGHPDLRPPEGEIPWNFPVGQRECIRLVLDIAESMGRVVKVVDVNRPAGDRALVERWAAAEAVLPLLVSPGGQRLEGADSFVPPRVRKFLSGT